MTQEPLVLAIETSSRAGSVAVALGRKCLAEGSFSGPMRHSSELFPIISGLLAGIGRAARQIDQVHISAGPGSFTGLRIAVTTAKMIHLASAAKVVGVDSLDVIASNLTDHTLGCSSDEISDTIATVLDAKRGHFFIAVYRRCTEPMEDTYELSDTHYTKIRPDCLMTAAQLIEDYADPERPVCLLGDGLLYHGPEFEADGIRLLDQRYWSPQAHNVHALGWRMAMQNRFADPVTLTPTYLRRPQIGTDCL